jgi:plastocyanin
MQREERRSKVRLRRLLLILSLGAAFAALPTIASSEIPPAVEAVGTGTGYYGQTYAWSPTQTTIAAGGSVTFSTGSTSAPHGIVWTSPNKPTCASSVPVGENNDGEHWSGSCTFAQAGIYTFHCSVHAEMTGEVVVNAAGTTTTTTSTTPPPTPPPSTGAMPAPPTPKPPAPAHLTRAQKLAKALKACRKEPKRKRAACIRQARKRYGPKKR